MFLLFSFFFYCCCSWHFFVLFVVVFYVTWIVYSSCLLSYLFICHIIYSIYIYIYIFFLLFVFLFTYWSIGCCCINKWLINRFRSFFNFNNMYVKLDQERFLEYFSQKRKYIQTLYIYKICIYLKQSLFKSN